MAESIENYEPRARVLSIAVEQIPERNTLNASITFQVVNTQEIVTVDVSLARLR